MDVIKIILILILGMRIMIMIIMIVLVMMMTITIKNSENEGKNKYYSCKILFEKKEITRVGVKSKKFKYVKLDCLMEMHSSWLEKRFFKFEKKQIVSYREVR